MTVLNPWFLLAAASVSVPIFLHLFHRRKVRRLSFPALRYLERTEREHAREIRLRQLLLLLARVAALLLLVAAGARLVVYGPSASHPPTAAVIVLDNSMSSGVVLGEERVLDVLKRVAGQALDGATSEDRFWVLRAGEPWVPAVPGGAAEARAAIRTAEPTGAGANLSEALARARDLLETSGFAAREIHLVSDLQRSAFENGSSAPAGSIPVVVWTPSRETPPNHGIVEVLVGGGLPPVEGQSAEIGVRLADATEGAAALNARAIVEGRIRAAATIPPGSEATLTLPPFPPGWVVGSVELDPDALSADDRRYFAFHSRPAPTIATVGDAGRFVRDALIVLQDANRARLGGPAEADLVVAAGGTSLETLPNRAHVLVVPPSDATLIPALNARLQAAGVSWSYRARSAAGGGELVGMTLPAGLEGARIDRWYELTREGNAPGSTVLAEVAGAPWAVEATGAEAGRVLLLGSPLDATASSLPVSAGLVRFLDWAASEWAGSGGSGTGRHAGARLDAPAAATHVILPDGTRIEIDGTRSLAATSQAGHYTFVAGDSVASVAAVNPPPEESDLTPLDRRTISDAIGAEATTVSDIGAWGRAVFRERRGPEIWWPLLLALVLLLLAESFLAASGKSGVPGRPTPRTEPAIDAAS